MDPRPPQPNEADGSAAKTPPEPPIVAPPEISEELGPVEQFEAEPDTNPVAPAAEPASTTPLPTLPVTPQPDTPATLVTPTEPAPQPTSEPVTDQPDPAPILTADPAITNIPVDTSTTGPQFFSSTPEKPNRNKLIIILAAVVGVIVIVLIIIFVIVANSSQPTNQAQAPTNQQPQLDKQAASAAIQDAVGVTTDSAEAEATTTNTDDTSEIEATTTDVNAVEESIDESSL